MAVVALETRLSLAAECAQAFARYAASPDESSLTQAYELGRGALSSGVGVVQTVQMCSRVLASALEHAAGDAERQRLADAAERFFVELVSPYEMTHRAARDANTVLRRLNDALEAQSRRIAGALHDEAAQLLAPVHLGLAQVARDLPPPTRRALTSLRCLLDDLEDRLRRIAHDMRPPILEDLGLVPALEFLATTTSRRWSLQVTLQLDVDTPMPPTVETTIFRVAQEGLTNVARHAAATQVWLTVVRSKGTVACSIRDDGKGLPEPRPLNGKRGLGLAGIKERVSALGGRVIMGPGEDGRGTLVFVEIPLEN
jgi:signal transduction histidine kinase